MFGVGYNIDMVVILECLEFDGGSYHGYRRSLVGFLVGSCLSVQVHWRFSYE